MMKKILSIGLILLMLVGMLAGCADRDAEEETTRRRSKKSQSAQQLTEPEESETQEPETETQAPTTAPTTAATTQAPTTEAPAAPEQTQEPLSTSFPYLLELPAEAPIYAQPGTDSKFVQYVGQVGTYTIMEEARDAAGQRWGKLKSGLGWVNVSDPLCGGQNQQPMTIYSATQATLDNDHYKAYVHSEYTRNIAIRANEPITNLCIVFTNMGQRQETVYTQVQLSTDKPLVAKLSFAGDFYGYCIEYTDANGTFHSHEIYESGKDGSLVINY